MSSVPSTGPARAKMHCVRLHWACLHFVWSGSWELSPSVRPPARPSKSLARGGARAAAARAALLSASSGFGTGPRRPHFPRRRPPWRLGTPASPAHLLPRGCQSGRVGAARVAPRPPARPPRPAALPASRLPVRPGPASGRHSPRPRVLVRRPSPRALHIRRPARVSRRLGQLRRDPGAAATRPGPGFCHFCEPPTSEPEKLEGRAGERPRETPPPPALQHKAGVEALLHWF